MSTNGNANGHSNGCLDTLQWKVGLINNKRKYLTAETFGHKVNASGVGLKKKQTWILEQQPQDKNESETAGEIVYIKSHLGFYLSADKYGEVTCDTPVEEIEPCNKFMIEYGNDGRWAFRNIVHGNYLAGDDDKVKCFSKNVTDCERWTVQFAMHPQVNIRNVIRKRYAVQCGDEIHCKEVVPWGVEGLLILHFDFPEGQPGKYSLKTSDNRFLHRDGSLVNDLQEDAKFDLEIRSLVNPNPGLSFKESKGLALKDSKGLYLTAVGSTASMKAGKNKAAPGKDDLFYFDHSHPQITITSQNGKFVSVKQGVDLSANQSEVCEESIFQMEYDKPSKKWAFRTCVDKDANKYCSLESFGGIQAASNSICSKSLFGLESNHDGTYCIRASNNKCLYNKQTGSILANVENPDTSIFKISMVNRPYLIFKCDYGFVGLKTTPMMQQNTTSKAEIICNKTTYGVTFIEPQGDGFYYLKALNDKYWRVADDKSIQADAETPSCKFLLEFQDQYLMTIQAPNGKYLKAEPNTFLAKGEEVDSTIMWEY